MRPAENARAENRSKAAKARAAEQAYEQRQVQEALELQRKLKRDYLARRRRVG